MGETTQKRMRFRRVILAITVLASLFILMAGLALAVWYGRGDSISQNPSLVSAYADVSATVSGQEYVAVVWSEGSTGHVGALKLRWGPPGEKWKWPITTIEYRDSQSQESAVAISGSTAYIAYIKRSGSNWVIGYAECLYGGACTKAPVYSQSIEMGKVDIAFCNGTRHVVWADATTGADDDIWYNSSTDGSWTAGSRQQVSTGGTDNSSPSIACYGGTAHVAWIQNDSNVMYANSSDWGTKTTVWSAGTNTPYNTSIAAYGNYVDVVWDYKDTSNDYWVRERRKSGSSWCTNEVPDASTSYASTDSDLIDEYMRYLQPAIAVYSDTAYAQPVPAVVWHADMVNYEVMYSYGTGFGGNCDVTWSAPISLTRDFILFKNDCSAPSVAIGISGTVTRTHVVFQQDVSGAEWEIYYTSDISSTLTQGEPPHYDVYMPIIMKSY